MSHRGILHPSSAIPHPPSLIRHPSSARRAKHVPLPKTCDHLPKKCNHAEDLPKLTIHCCVPWFYLLVFSMSSNDHPERRRLDHVPPAWSPENATYFITVCAQPRGRNSLCVDAVAGKLLKSIVHYHTEKKWFCELALLMPDHLHAFLVFPWDRTMSSTLQDWKRYTARTCGINWQRDFFEHRIRNEKRHVETWHYIRHNPVRSGLVHQPDDWLYRWQPR